MWRVSTAPVAASASIGVNRKKFWLLINVTWTGRSPAQRRASSTAAVTPAKPPPRITILGASEVDGRASTRPAAGAVIAGALIDIVTVAITSSLSRVGCNGREGGFAPSARRLCVCYPTTGASMWARSSHSDKPPEQPGEAAAPGRRVIEARREEGIDSETAAGIGEEEDHRPHDQHDVGPTPLVRH